MDEATLRRLAEGGLLGDAPQSEQGIPPGELTALGEWCIERGESTIKASLMVVGSALVLVGGLWEDSEQGIPHALAAEIDSVIRRQLPGILGEPDDEAQMYLARHLRDSLRTVVDRWSDWQSWWLHPDPGPG